jgi:hypothetical protein
MIRKNIKTVTTKTVKTGKSATAQTAKPTFSLRASKPSATAKYSLLSASERSELARNAAHKAWQTMRENSWIRQHSETILSEAKKAFASKTLSREDFEILTAKHNAILAALPKQKKASKKAA